MAGEVGVVGSDLLQGKETGKWLHCYQSVPGLFCLVNFPTRPGCHTLFHVRLPVYSGILLGSFTLASIRPNHGHGTWEYCLCPDRSFEAAFGPSGVEECYSRSPFVEPERLGRLT